MKFLIIFGFTSILICASSSEPISSDVSKEEEDKLVAKESVHDLDAAACHGNYG